MHNTVSVYVQKPRLFICIIDTTDMNVVLYQGYNARVYYNITKTRLYTFDPLNPLLYSKTGVYEAVLTSTHNLCFEQKYEKY